MAELTAPYFYEVTAGTTPELPDFKSIGNLGREAVYQAIFAGYQYAPVVSLTTLREHEGAVQVLAGPRNPKVNRTHPNVISVPTMRLPAEYAAAAMLKSKVARQTAKEQVFEREWKTYPNEKELETHVLSNIVSGVMAAKIGLADVTVLRIPELRMSLESFTLGFSLVDFDAKKNAETIEAIGMLNAAVVVPSDIEAPKSATFSRLKWFDIEDFQTGYQNRDATILFPEDPIDAIEMCVHGVCLATTSAVFDRGISVPTE